MAKTAIIIGAGPAGLTAAYELLQRTDIVPVILEKSGDIGGISKTVNYKGNRIDIGGHRFFSKSDRVMEWWLHIMPVEGMDGQNVNISYQNKSRQVNLQAGQDNSDNVMLVRKRLSRVYFLRKFFTYPIQLSFDTLKKLGFLRTVSILLSYFKVRLFPRRREKSLEDFFINRFGNVLYRLFFKDYTEKVWGVSCTKISAEWGAQRIKGISIAKAIEHALRSMKPTAKNSSHTDISQKGIETSMIEKFLYPKYGPGQLWEEVARQVEAMGGKILKHQQVKAVFDWPEHHSIRAIEAVDTTTGESSILEGDYFFSTMPVSELIAGMRGAVPDNIREIANGLQYRDFITVGVLLKKMPPPNQNISDPWQRILPDTWIYIQEKDVKVGRLQIFNNWSPYMVKDPETVWVGMEYFCNQGDSFWNLTDQDIQAAAITELERMGLAGVEDVLDSTVLRMEKTYPAYFGTYNRFEEIRAFTDTFENLFLVGRNGMHKYNNSDHSMLTAMVAVDNIAAGITSKANIWCINTEQEYHEVKNQHSPASMSPKPASFYPDFVWKDKYNRAYWISAVVVFVIQFVIFKFRYPYANYMPDSYSYLEAASSNADVNMWPVAYSKFLRAISAFTHSDKIVTGIQYLLLQCSTLVFVLSVSYLCRPGKAVKNTLYIFCLLNPIPIYIGNYISADALFISLSILWMTTLCWIIYRSKSYQIVLQAVLLLAAFTVRYNAIYYPLIATLTFLLSKKSWSFKLSGIVMGLVLVFASYFFTSTKMKEVSGHQQFSAFGGWQLANNALYMYEHIPASERQPPPAKFTRLEAMVRKHMDTLNKVPWTHSDTVDVRFYLWSSRGPLIQYMLQEWKKDSTTPYFKRWASEGPLYAEYGAYLIRKYPWAYLQNFVLSNTVKLIVPPIEFIGVYNMGEDSVGQLAKNWFNYKSLRVSNQKKDAQVKIIQPSMVFAALVNASLFLSCIGLLLFTGAIKTNKIFFRLFVVIMSFWLVNGGFSVLVSPITLRYQYFPILVCFTFSLLAIDLILKGEKRQLP